MIKRSHSLLNRFDPYESKAHYRKRENKRIQDTLLWLKFKLFVNSVELEKPKEIEAAWQESLHPELKDEIEARIPL